MRIFFWSGLLLVLLLCAHQCRADLHDSTNAADYLIIAPSDVVQGYPWITELAGWRNRHGRTARVVVADSIWDEFGNGLPSDSTLKDFLFYVYHHWRTPQLDDVFLIGWHDVLPSHIVPDSMGYQDTTGHPRWERTDYLSDLFYATDPDNNNFVPLFNVGRLPWSPARTPILYHYYSKVLAYESAPESDWQWRVHAIADNGDHGLEWFQLSEQWLAHIQSGYTIVRNYLMYPPGTPWHGDSTNIMANLQAGSFLTIPMGRGGLNRWGLTMPLDSSNLATLTNGPAYFITMGISSEISTNDFTLSSIPHTLLENTHGGAIAYLAQSSIAYVGQTVAYKSAFCSVATSDSAQTVGDLWRLTATHYLREGEFPLPIINATMLLGDPGVRLPATPSAVEPPITLHPSSFSLSCYPNPFNPTTQIQFDLPRAGHVKLQVTNVLGQHVATLIDGHSDAGTQSVTWNASTYPSGLYLAVLEAGGARHVTKMMLLK